MAGMNRRKCCGTFKRYFPGVYLALIGAVAGTAIQLNRLYHYGHATQLTHDLIVFRILMGLLLGPAVLLALHNYTIHSAYPVLRSTKSTTSADTVACKDALSFTPLFFLIPVYFGYRIQNLAMVLIAITVMLWKLYAFQEKQPDLRGIRRFVMRYYCPFLFFVSGFAALIYHVVWQRVLYSCFGSNIESAVVIASAFMLGLGLGAVCGGHLVKRYPERLPALFLLCEAGIAGYGFFSIGFINAVSAYTNDYAPPITFVAMFLLLLFPTMLMGATLPILVTLLFRDLDDIGISTGIVYGLNTLGSGLAAFMTVEFFFPYFGLQRSIWIAVVFNALVCIGLQIRPGPAFRTAQ